MKIRRAERNDLDLLVTFTAAEARDAEGETKDVKTLADGIKAALADRSIAMYWVLVNEDNQPVGMASALKEWSDWNAGYYCMRKRISFFQNTGSWSKKIKETSLPVPLHSFDMHCFA